MEKEVNQPMVGDHPEKKSFIPAKILTILIFVVIIAIIVQIGFFSYSYLKNNSNFFNATSIIGDKMTSNSAEDVSINTTVETNNTPEDTNTSIQNQSTTNTTTINTTTSTGCTLKTCADYPGRCGFLNDGCGKIIDCFLACEHGSYCFIGEAETTNICVNNSLLCRDSDSGVDYYHLGIITLRGTYTDSCNATNLTEHFCYYTGTEFEVRNETIECGDGCSGGACL